MKSIGEFELIRELCAQAGSGRRALLGPGDDCAILRPSRAAQLLTIDSMVEGVHFRLQWGTPEQIGERSLTVNLSDIAAMGGVPTTFVVNLGVPRGLKVPFFRRLYEGMGRAASAAGAEMVGGNVTRTSVLEITIALMGEVRSNSLRRDAAHVGDDVWVTGTLGDAAAGLRILEGKSKARGAASQFLKERFLRPTARLEAGQRLARIRPAPAAIDISDGLVQDLGHIAERSGVGAEIDPHALPLSEAYRQVIGDDPELALAGGDDYELLFCLHPGFSEAAVSRKLSVPAHRIGRIRRAKGVRLIEGTRRRSSRRGWDQLRSGSI